MMRHQQFVPPNAFTVQFLARALIVFVPLYAYSFSLPSPSSRVLSSSSIRRGVLSHTGDNRKQRIGDSNLNFFSLKSSSTVVEDEREEEMFDVVVIGAGIGGLCCASLLATAGRKVLVLESHYEIGGCAHEYLVDVQTGKTIPSVSGNDRKDVFRFEAGPSLYSGLSSERSPNPLKHVYQMIEEEPEWITYDRWGAFLPEAPDGYELSIGAENFLKILDRYGGPNARNDWEALASQLRPLAQTIMGLPSTTVRGDAGILLTLGLSYPKKFLEVLSVAKDITAPFNLQKLGVTDPFLKNYLDLIAFLLQGLPADETLTAVMAYMVEDFYREGAVMDYPKGGSKGLVDALARGVTKHDGCEVRVSSTVDEVVVEDGRAIGVRMKNKSKKQLIRAKDAVVSNTDLRMTFDLVRTPHEAFDQERNKLLGVHGNDEGNSIPLCKSFMHLHLGVPEKLIPDDAPAQWTVVRDWDLGIDGPGNVVVVSCPSKLDPSLAPPGYHVIHAYGAGNEPYQPWEPFEDLDARARNSNEAYQALKKERSQPLWDAIAKRAPLVIPGAPVVEQIGTPLTHSRFLKRHRGNYGLAIAAGNDEGLSFPQVTTPLPGYYRCGDSTTSGIGVPAVASSGAQCANALLSVWEQLKLNKKIMMP